MKATVQPIKDNVTMMLKIDAIIILFFNWLAHTKL